MPGNEHSAVPIRAILYFSGRADEAIELKPSGRSNAEYAPKGTALGWKGKRKVYGEGKQRMEEKRKIRVGTWNVRTMNAMEKLENVKEEMRRNRLSIMSVSEVRWKDGGDFVFIELLYECESSIVTSREASWALPLVSEMEVRLACYMQ